MPRTRRIVSQALATLERNLRREGDPLGMRQSYWTDWAQGLDLPAQGERCLYTGRMYQMLPYVAQTTKLVARYQSWLACPGMATLMNLGSRLAGEATLRRLAASAGEIRQRASDSLRGIWAGLKAVGASPAYLQQQEPYSGVLLYDLGLEASAQRQAAKLAGLFSAQGFREVIAVDPHSLHLLRGALPETLERSGVAIRHYLEVLAPEREKIARLRGELPIQEVVVHDSCVMARELGIIDQVRQVAQALGLKVKEPADNRENTACCGGPIEYAFGELSRQVSRLRAQELARVSSQVLVTCPICLLNLTPYESELGIRVWDLGELLQRALGAALSSDNQR
ncbi:MAG: (Fe-S)-binding protein [Thermodesulfobacteriota bacterium]